MIQIRRFDRYWKTFGWVWQKKRKKKKGHARFCVCVMSHSRMWNSIVRRRSKNSDTTARKFFSISPIYKNARLRKGWDFQHSTRRSRAVRFLNILKKKKQNKRRGEWEEMYVILINAQRSAGRAHASLTVANEIIDFFLCTRVGGV